MKRLIVFGCSYAYGHGLLDCFVPPYDPGKQPSNLGWPAMLAHKLDRELVNISEPGASNRQIVHFVQNFDFKKDDICIIHWTFIERTFIVRQKGTEKIGSWSKTKSATEYYRHVQNSFNDLHSSRIYIDYVSYKLKSMGIPNLNFGPVIHPNLKLEEYVPLIKYDNPVDEKTLLYFEVDRALDNSHPGPKSNLAFAEYILNEYKHILK